MTDQYRCVSCQFFFRTGDDPKYCPGCGLPRNEQFGLSVARSNPNITGLVVWDD